MILSHKQIEEIAAAVTKDFNEFFSGKMLTMRGQLLRRHRLTSLPRIISA